MKMSKRVVSSPLLFLALAIYKRKGRVNMSFNTPSRLLSHPVRREIFRFVKNGQDVCWKPADQFELTGATISHHLNVLKQADLVVETREKNFIYYELNTSVLEDIWWCGWQTWRKIKEMKMNKNIRTNNCYDSVACACGLFLLGSATRNDGNAFWFFESSKWIDSVVDG